MLPEAIQSMPTGGDPFLDVLKWIVVAVTLIVVSGSTIISYIKSAKGNDSVEVAKDDAEILLYSQLQEQLRRMDEDVQELTHQKNRLFEEWATLKVRSEYQEKKLNELSKSDAIICKLRETLVEKDKDIALRDKENKKLMRDILDMKDRIYHLEMRLAEDEKKFCNNCPTLKKKKQALEKIQPE